MADMIESMEILEQNSKRRHLLGRIAAVVTAFAVLAACLVPVLAQIEWPTRITRFERYDPVYTEYVEPGTAQEDLSLPEYLRAVISLNELDLDQDTFVQAQPEVDTSDGYTHYDYYYYGYVAPADAEEKYESGKLAVYTIYYAAQDGSGTVGETAHRVYGSINGSQNVWFACDETGEITDVILDVPVTWNGDYDPDTAGEYTFTAEFEDYTYKGSNPTAVITVYDGSALEEDGEEEETAILCTCDLGTNELSADHAEDCPCYEVAEEILCTCDLKTNDMGSDHASDCPMYILEMTDCHCGTDGEAIAEDNYPWQHNVDCVYYSPIECMCREQVEVTYEEDMDGETYISTIVVPGNFTHVHDETNTDCPLYGKNTVTIEKQDKTARSAQLMGGTTSVMSVEDAKEIFAYQEETGSALYSALGMISIVEGSEQSTAASASALSANGGGSNDTSMDNYMRTNTPTSNNGEFRSDYAGTTIPGTWIDYVNTIWMNKAANAFAWTADADTGAYNNWIWSGGVATGSGNAASTANAIPTKSSSNVWVVYSGEQLRYALLNFSSGDTIQLGGNINLNGDDYNWETVAVSGYKSLTLDGNGYTIYNLGMYNTTNSTYTVFLSGVTEGMTVTDITFSTAKLIGANDESGTGIFRFTTSGSNASLRYMTMTNVTVQDSVFYQNNTSGMVSPFGRISATGSASRSGMIPRISNCSTIGNYIYSTDHCAGFSFGAGGAYYARDPGYNESNWGQFTNCYSVDNLLCGTGGHSAGFSSCNGEGAMFESCFSVNEIYGSAAVGGFLGGLTSHANNCYSSGKLEGYSVLGGFAFAYVTNVSDNAERHFTNCYSTMLVGLRTNPARQGGFSSTLVYEKEVETEYHDEYQTNCYAAGEVGNFDLDMANPKTVGGYLDILDNEQQVTPVPDDLYTFDNCYYDKQTTAMREWAAGDTQSISGVTGMLTTELTSASFNGFSNMSDWVLDTQNEEHYPQLAVFANATASDWGSETTANLVKAYSLASTSTVFLDEWKTGYTWTDLGVRSVTEVEWDAPGSGSNNAGAEYTYDTVREIISNFTVTSTSEWTEQIEGGAPSLVTSADGSETTATQTITIDNDSSSGTVVNPGMNWYDIEEIVNGETASRPIRLIAYMSIEAGDNATISSGELYNHRTGVLLTMVDSLTEDLVVGLDDEKSWSSSVEQEWPVVNGADGSEEQVDAYYGVQTENTSFSSTEGAIINTEIWLAELETGGDGGVVVYEEPDTDAEYYYDADSGGWLKAQMAVHVTGEGSENSVSSRKFRGDIPLYPDTSSGRKYIISYYWILEDGRYVTDYKVVTITPGQYSVDMYVYNIVDGSANSSLLYLDVALDHADGSVGYDVSSGITASSESLPWNSEANDNTVKYTTNVTAAWRKATADTKVQKIDLQLYYRDGTLAGEASVEADDIKDGQEITIPTLLYYYLEVVQEGTAERENTMTQIVDVTYTVVEVKDENGIGTGEYYLRFNKLINAPEDEWAGAFSESDDTTGISLPADSADEEIEAYINDLQFDTVITLWVAVTGYELPEVGGIGTIPYIIGGAGLLALAVIGSIMLRRRKRGKEDKGV